MCINNVAGKNCIFVFAFHAKNVIYGIQISRISFV